MKYGCEPKHEKMALDWFEFICGTANDRSADTGYCTTCGAKISFVGRRESALGVRS